MKIRPYTEKDRTACLEILDGNTPEFFVASDHDALGGFLSHLPGPYFVGEEHEEVVACGGWALDSAKVALLTWGMVRRAQHGRGLGRMLLRFRLDAIKTDTRANVVRIHTVQLVQGFFAKEGFVAIDTVPNGFGPGLDRVTMELRLRTAAEHGA